jgi:hypothetical protein
VTQADELSVTLASVPAAYPVLISLGVSQSTPSVAGGWHLHAFGHQLEGSQLELRRGKRVSGTCRFTDLAVDGSSGKPQERRALAIDWDRCRSVEEVGQPSAAEVQRFFSADNPWSDSDPQLGARSSRTAKSRPKSKSRVIMRAASDPRRYYRFKAIWEDPVGLDTSWIAPKINWAYYGGCVHNPVYYGVDWGTVTTKPDGSS